MSTVQRRACSTSAIVSVLGAVIAAVAILDVALPQSHVPTLRECTELKTPHVLDCGSMLRIPLTREYDVKFVSNDLGSGDGKFFCRFRQRANALTGITRGIVPSNIRCDK
jgi:hypothetical protein